MADLLATSQNFLMSIAMMIGGALLALVGRFLNYSGDPFLPQSIAGVSEQLLAQGVISPDTSAAQKEVLAKQVRLRMAWLIMGVGIGIAIPSGGMAAAALAVTKSSDSFDGVFNITQVELFLIGGLLGMAVGYYLSMRRGAVVAAATATHPRLSHRSALDYYSLVLWLAMLVFYGFVATLEYVTASQSPPVTFSALGASRQWPGNILGIALALVTLAVPIVGLICAQWIACMPGPRIENDPIRTERFTNFLRARAITMLLGSSVLIGFTFFSLATANIPFNAHSGLLGALNTAVHEISGTVYALLFFAIFAFAFIGMLSARMGGRLTGWWWQRRPERRERAAAGEV